MLSDDSGRRRIPSLVSLCQRGLPILWFQRAQPYIIIHSGRRPRRLCVSCHSNCIHTMLNGDLSAITNLGPDICFRLVKPILERCEAEQLLQIEDASPVCCVIILNG